jgi:hypothetical protein
LRTGQPIRLDGGPLGGLSGLLLKTRGTSRLVVSISLLQRSVTVEVDQAWIRSTDWSQASKADPAGGEPNRGAAARKAHAGR